LRVINSLKQKINLKMNEIFSIKGKVAIISGAGGVLGGSIAKSFIQAGAKVVAIDIRQENLDSRIKELTDLGGEAIGVIGNVLDIESLEKVAETVVEKWGRIDILLNIAGGNIPAATLSADQCFFDMDLDGWNKATNLNMNGTVYPSYVFGKVMAKQGSGSIINISSMAAYSAITRVAGYSAAKAAITNFTQWLASDLAIKFGDGIRVNAIAPGFLLVIKTEIFSSIQMVLLLREV
jgi:NAD(P)-dependent dehydrogenase (short-subunit alcohol dehydrogenase family)